MPFAEARAWAAAAALRGRCGAVTGQRACAVEWGAGRAALYKGTLRGPGSVGDLGSGLPLLPPSPPGG